MRQSVLLAALCLGLGASVNAGAEAPPMAGDLPELSGSAWRIDFGSGLTGTVFLFCAGGGHWETVPASGSIGLIGKSWAVSGSTLTTVNADDGMTQDWALSWDAEGEWLTIDDGALPLKLKYHGTTACR